MAKSVSLSVGRGEKLPVSKGAGLTAKGRACELCGIDITDKRADARFCCRSHKRQTSDAQRNYALEYKKNAVHKRTLTLSYYHRDGDKNRAKMLKRQKLNPALYAANAAKYRAIKLQRTPGWLTKDDFLIIRKFYELATQQTKISGFSWHVDHIVPLQGARVSGLHVPSNLQVIPATQNIAKHNRFEVVQ
jgi:hypothetical protein